MAHPARSQNGAVDTAYFDGPVRAFALAAVLWGVVGMLVGVVIAAQLAWPDLNEGIPG
jgi:cytochrome c oxidase cbb3-type subunit 1